MPKKLPKLPQLLARKIYKTGQTRGADDDQIFQNRVGRNSTVLIPFSQFQFYFDEIEKGLSFENGYIVLISPEDYFSSRVNDEALTKLGLRLGSNSLIFYETRSQWLDYNPKNKNWSSAQKRLSPLGGKYVARISATTAAENGEKINAGFITTSGKGAGIRVYEYANSNTIGLCRLQLEAVFWLCKDSESVAISNGMIEKDARQRKIAIFETCKEKGLLNFPKLIANRVVNESQKATCPLCLEELSGAGFFSKMEQALGREVHNLTITHVNLFHINELRVGLFNHCPYNLGWGHHHCNVVVKDSGIKKTLEWMGLVLERNSLVR